ncbi:helix-turn-helix transcriptional regulator [Bradyrhizobium sp.]|uniref:helix-turn-helix transcriptional regulator n=1 Tax=Bradyrhizobium sp. TaxID=376 RepID=UPI003C43297D
MITETTRLLNLIGLIYDAVLEPELWNAVLEKTAEFVGGMGASIFRQDVIRKVGNAYYTWGMDPDYEQLYFKKYIHHNPLLPAMMTVGVGQVSSNSEQLVPTEFFETRFYKEWAKPQGLIDNVFCILERSATSAAGLVVFRHERDGMADPEAFGLLAVLVPHLRRAVLIGNIVEHKSAEAQGFSDLLDSITAGVFVVDARGNLIYSNKAGKNILSEGDYLRAAAGKLSARRSETDQLLQDAFRATGDGDAAISNKSIAIPLMAADGTRRVANLLPLTRRRIAGIDETATAAVFVHKAALELPNPPEVIADAYQLTKAELRVLLALMELGGGPQIAKALGIGTGTVKTHLRNLFQKTGVKHQADLVKLVAGFSQSVVG